MILVHFFCALSWGYGIKKVSLRLKNEFYEDKDRCQFRKLKKIKKIKKLKKIKKIKTIVVLYVPTFRIAT